MDEAQSVSTPRPRLETKCFRDQVKHTRDVEYVEKANDRNEMVKEEWRNCGELGRGGFGVVYKQIQQATGRYRAVKEIDKKPGSPLDYSREHRVMAKLAKVCDVTPSLLSLPGCLVF